MHLEYESYLRTLLAEAQSSSPLFPLHQHKNFGVLDCPSAYGHVLSSDLCFYLARKGEMHSLDIAQALFEVHERKRAAEGRYFQIALGGQGHLNATPTEAFYQEYFFTLFEKGISLLFQRESFVISAEREKGEGEKKEKPKEEVPLFSFSWDRLVKENQHQEEVQLFLDEQDLVSFDQQLMLLALMGDPELEYRPFRERLNGRQNVPWYIRRFLYDTKQLLKKLDALSSFRQEERTVLNWHSFGMLLLGFRHVFFRTQQRGTVPDFANYLVRIIRDFYSYYNKPETRKLLNEGSNERILSQFGEMTRALRDTINTALQVLENSCASSKFTLQVSKK